MERLKRRWGIESNIQIILICIVFAINGSFAAWVAKPITLFLGLSPETMNPFLYWTFRVFLIFPIYQLTLPIVGFVFGQFKFFWNFEKKFLSRIGLGFLFKKEKK
ncbi:MAG: diacylglyceryl transferase [Flavobacteriales bacterium]|nr:diacylglyceryl transferase [Flavobacteriales bacterium]